MAVQLLCLWVLLLEVYIYIDIGILEKLNINRAAWNCTEMKKQKCFRE